MYNCFYICTYIFFNISIATCCWRTSNFCCFAFIFIGTHTITCAGVQVCRHRPSRSHLLVFSPVASSSPRRNNKRNYAFFGLLFCGFFFVFPHTLLLYKWVSRVFCFLFSENLNVQAKVQKFCFVSLM